METLASNRKTGKGVRLQKAKGQHGWVDINGATEEELNVVGATRIAAEQGSDGVWRKVISSQPFEYWRGVPDQSPPANSGQVLNVEALSPSPEVFETAVVNALKGDDVITRPATSKEVNQGLWEAADTKAIMKLVDGPDPVISKNRVRRKEVDFACGLVMVRNWHLNPEGEVVEQKSRAAADGRNDPRDVDGHIALPDVTLHRLVM